MTIDNVALKIFSRPIVNIDAYNDAYSLWKRVWLETRTEIGSNETWSDSFSRQDEVLVLYHEGRPIATCCHRYVDLSNRSVLHDSYFTSEMWPDAVIRLLPSLGRRFVLGGGFYVEPEARAIQLGFSVKRLLASLCFEHLNRTQPDVMIGMVRIDRGLHRLFHECGAISLHDRVMWRGIVPLDPIAMFPRDIPIPIPSEMSGVVARVSFDCPSFGIPPISL